jgi:mannosyltransferase OCH1-like enzyme
MVSVPTSGLIVGSKVMASKTFAPALLAAVRQRAHRQRTVAQGLSNRAWVRDITGAITVQVIVEYLQIWNLVENQVINDLAEDRFIWKWTADHCFTTASAYRAFFIGQHPISRAKLLRKTKAPDRCKFFV